MVDDSFAKDLKELSKQEDILNLSINELKSIVISKVEDLTELYPNRTKPLVIKTVLNNATKLYSKNKATKEDLYFVIDELEKEITKKNNLNEKAKKEALQEADRKALEEEKILNEAKNGTLEDNILANMANMPPNSKTNINPFRPKWIKYDISINKWKLDSTSLAKTIIDENSILRMQENGELQGYWIYNELTGSWHPLSVEDIDNIVNSYFEFPADPQYKTPGMYALDQQTAKNQRDVLKLVLSKVKGASPKLTIDKQPPYLIHFKDYDFDLKGWNIQPFNPDNYFISDRNYNLQEDVLNLKNLIFEDGGKELIDSLAPESTNWLLKSLGDKETLQTFLECLGLSFLNFQPEQFVIFIKSKGGTGKSVLFNYIKTLFGIDNDVIQLDFEHIIKDNSFDVSELRRKSINLTSDAKATYIPTEAVSIIKALSGNDARNLPQKFQKTADFVNHANLWFNCNKVPRLSPDSYDNSIARRFIIFDWLYIHNFQWEKKENVFQKERGELVLKALYYAKLALEMQPKKYDYLSTPVHITRSQRVINNYISWEHEHNLLDRFINEKCEIGPFYKVGVTHFREQYSQYLIVNGHKQNVAVETLENQLEEQYQITKSHKPTSWKNGTETKTGVYVFKGVALKEDAGIQEEDQKFEADRIRRRKAYPFIPH